MDNFENDNNKQEMHSQRGNQFKMNNINMMENDNYNNMPNDNYNNMPNNNYNNIPNNKRNNQINYKNDLNDNNNFNNNMNYRIGNNMMNNNRFNNDINNFNNSMDINNNMNMMMNANNNFKMVQDNNNFNFMPNNNLPMSGRIQNQNNFNNNYQILKKGPGLTNQEIQVIINSTCEALNGREEPLSKGIIKRIKTILGGDWVVFAYIDGLKGYDLSVSTYDGDKVISYVVDNFRFEVINLKV